MLKGSAMSESDKIHASFLAQSRQHLLAAESDRRPNQSSAKALQNRKDSGYGKKSSTY